MPQRGARLSPEWARFLQQLERSIRQRLYNLVRYCSARCIEPTSVDDTLFDEYWRYRAENTGRPTNNTAKRFMVRAWNGCLAAMDGLPLQGLTEPPIKTAEPAWEKFPVGLRRDIDGYLARFSKPHRTLNGERIQPCRPSTIAYRRAELVAFCRAAVKLGVPIESLNSLGSLLHPDVVEPVIDSYWRRNGDEPKAGTIDYWLVFPNYDVKNRVDLNFKFDEPLTDLIAEYVDEHRSTLLRGANSSWLFPGEDGQPKNGLLFSKQITERIQKAVGLRITVHQFRHAAAAIYLQHHPGDYETVRRVLGHRSLTTTIKFYCGLETIAASEQFGRLIRERIEFNDETDG